jgi:ParB family chromosome partitioning protein
MTAKWWGKMGTAGEKAEVATAAQKNDGKAAAIGHGQLEGEKPAGEKSAGQPAAMTAVEVAASARPAFDKTAMPSTSSPEKPVAALTAAVSPAATTHAEKLPGAVALSEKPAVAPAASSRDKPAVASVDKPAVLPVAEKPTLAHDKRKALGRGLESLLPGPRVVAPTAGTGALDVAAGPVPGVITELHGQAAPRRVTADHEVLDLALELIDDNPHQTRTFTTYEEESLPELSESIKVQGVIQPISVRPGKDGRYFLIAGERRLRASKMAGKKTIPAIVRVVSEQQAAEMTVIENLQRKDLKCIDLARAYAALSRDFGMTQEQIGQRVGTSRESVSNHMRLLKLPEAIHVYLENGELEFSHARALLNISDPHTIGLVAHKAVTENMSVDDLERFILFDKSMFKDQKPPARQAARWVDPNVRAAQRKLEEMLGVRVRIRDRKGKGKITLEYSTLEDFDRVLGMLTGKGSR